MRLTRAEFHELAERAFADLPPALKGLLRNLEIATMARPGREAGKWQGSTKLLGLYKGLTRSDMGPGAGAHLPARIILYQRNLEAVYPTMAELERGVRDTLRHELGHHLGMTDADLRRLGY